MNIQKPEDWYRVTYDTVLAQEGGYFVKNYYGGSVIRGIVIGDILNSLDVALQSVYPEHKHLWQERRPHKSMGFWQDMQNRRNFLDQLAIKWNIQKPQDWYKVTSRMAVNQGGTFIVSVYNGSLIRGTVSV
jgi:hypothetical protein